MRRVLLGTAHLYATTGPGTAGAVLDAAWTAGVRHFDTAPSYGHGETEPHLGTFLAGRDDAGVLATKVGLEPSGRPRPGRATLVRAVDRLVPATAARRLRQAVRGRSVAEGPGRAEVYGHFAPDEVRRSVERSLRRLGRVDRLLLHEVLPEDVTDELVAVLSDLVAAGDVGEVGAATANRHTAAVLAAAGPVLTAAQFAAGPMAEAPELPAHVTTRVGHGLLGAGGADLAVLRRTLDRDPELHRRWRDAVRDTGFEDVGQEPLAAAVLARDPGVGLTDVVVATGRPGRGAGTARQAAGEEPVPATVASALETVVAVAREPAAR